MMYASENARFQGSVIIKMERDNMILTGVSKIISYLCIVATLNSRGIFMLAFPHWFLKNYKLELYLCDC